MDKINFFVFSDDCDGESGRVVCAVKKIDERAIIVGVSFQAPKTPFDMTQLKIDADKQLKSIEIVTGKFEKHSTILCKHDRLNFMFIDKDSITNSTDLMLAARFGLLSSIKTMDGAPDWAKEMRLEHQLKND